MRVSDVNFKWVEQSTINFRSGRGKIFRKRRFLLYNEVTFSGNLILVSRITFLNISLRTHLSLKKDQLLKLFLVENF